jgi:RNA-directed DNA polymerase
VRSAHLRTRTARLVARRHRTPARGRVSREGRTDREVAAALAEALLAGVWAHDELVRRAARTLGSTPSWLPALLDELLVLFPEPPVESAELVAAITYSTEFGRGAAAARNAGAPLRAVPPKPPAPRVSDWLRLPQLGDPAELAAWLELSPGQLSWLADPYGFQVRTRPGPLHLYDYTWVTRPDRPPRLLEAPTPILKRVQRQLLHGLLDRVPVHPAAHGFVPGRSVLSHARHHLGAEVVITVDLVSFFAQITRARVAGLLRVAGCAPTPSALLAGICTTRTPGSVLSRMPAGGTGDQRYALRARLRAPHLAQGAPTSPVLANLSCFHLDRRLSGYAAQLPAEFTRYADDLSFSGGPALRMTAAAFVRGVTRIVTDEGFTVNPAKTRVHTRGRRQVVTGVVVNERPNVTRRDYDRLRAVLHQARTAGPEAANRTGHPDFQAHLTGRVQWVESLNPPRGRRLRADLDAIRWDEPDG